MADDLLPLRQRAEAEADPSYSPELDPVERVWLYLRERFLSLRVLADTEAILDACRRAGNALVADPDRPCSLCACPWITKVNS